MSSPIQVDFDKCCDIEAQVQCLRVIWSSERYAVPGDMCVCVRWEWKVTRILKDGWTFTFEIGRSGEEW